MREVDVAAVGHLLGDRSRVAMLEALMSGRALTAGELASVAGIGAPAASEHLRRLVEGDLVGVVAQGRHRYYRLSGPDVAAALETLSLIAPTLPVTGLRQSSQARALSHARTCYDHLAGVVGVALHDALLDQGWLAPSLMGYDITNDGRIGLRQGLDLDVAHLRVRRGVVARSCLDWTERRHHLAGPLAAALLSNVQGRGWLVPRTTHHRALRLTPSGRVGLGALGCPLPET